MIFEGPKQVGVFQAIVIKNALKYYIKTGKKINTDYTPKNMMAMAIKITGKTFKPRQYELAVQAIEEWLQARKPIK